MQELEDLSSMWVQEVRQRVHGKGGFVRMTGEDFLRGEITKFVTKRTKWYTEKTEPEGEDGAESGASEAEDVLASRKELLDKLGTVLDGLKCKLVAACYEPAVEVRHSSLPLHHRIVCDTTGRQQEVAIVCAETLEQKAIWSLDLNAGANAADKAKAWATGLVRKPPRFVSRSIAEAARPCRLGDGSATEANLRMQTRSRALDRSRKWALANLMLICRPSWPSLLSTRPSLFGECMRA